MNSSTPIVEKIIDETKQKLSEKINPKTEPRKKETIKEQTSEKIEGKEKQRHPEVNTPEKFKTKIIDKVRATAGNLMIETTEKVTQLKNMPIVGGAVGGGVLLAIENFGKILGPIMQKLEALFGAIEKSIDSMLAGWGFGEVKEKVNEVVKTTKDEAGEKVEQGAKIGKGIIKKGSEVIADTTVINSSGEFLNFLEKKLKKTSPDAYNLITSKIKNYKEGTQDWWNGLMETIGYLGYVGITTGGMRLALGSYYLTVHWCKGIKEIGHDAIESVQDFYNGNNYYASGKLLTNYAVTGLPIAFAGVATEAIFSTGSKFFGKSNKYYESLSHFPLKAAFLRYLVAWPVLLPRLAWHDGKFTLIGFAKITEKGAELISKKDGGVILKGLENFLSKAAKGSRAWEKGMGNIQDKNFLTKFFLQTPFEHEEKVTDKNNTETKAEKKNAKEISSKNPKQELEKWKEKFKFEEELLDIKKNGAELQAEFQRITELKKTNPTQAEELAKKFEAKNRKFILGKEKMFSEASNSSKAKAALFREADLGKEAIEFEKLTGKEMTKFINGIDESLLGKVIKSTKGRLKFAAILAVPMFFLEKRAIKEKNPQIETLELCEELGKDTLQLIADIAAPFGVSDWYTLFSGEEYITSKKVKGWERWSRGIWGVASTTADAVAILTGGASSATERAIATSMRAAGKAEKIEKAIASVPRIVEVAGKMGWKNFFNTIKDAGKSPGAIKALQKTSKYAYVGGGMATIGGIGYDLIYEGPAVGDAGIEDPRV